MQVDVLRILDGLFKVLQRILENIFVILLDTASWMGPRKTRETTEVLNI